ncbi:hypothetical protein [Devosia submarina]|uniref:hypothetical protein n=1 Tax=Devosia submarina TaxID=1173082 RepID=UPI000D3A4120|nr:hypothetical protein [Devosia submarina]
MPKFRFTKDYDFKPTSQMTVAFPKGHEGEIVTGAAASGKITNAVVEAALKAGAGEHVGEPAKAEKPKANG